MDDSVLGPKKCLQLASSVPKKRRGPPNKDGFKNKASTEYVFHCKNQALVLDKTQATCYWPYHKCDQCAGVPLRDPQAKTPNYNLMRRIAAGNSTDSVDEDEDVEEKSVVGETFES